MCWLIVYVPSSNYESRYANDHLECVYVCLFYLWIWISNSFSVFSQWQSFRRTFNYRATEYWTLAWERFVRVKFCLHKCLLIYWSTKMGFLFFFLGKYITIYEIEQSLAEKFSFKMNFTWSVFETIT